MLAQAQTEHLKFMGIPINGTIEQFHSKLISKGLKYNAQTTRDICEGRGRIYNGNFAGEKDEIYVYLNEKNRIVYRAKAVIDRNDYNSIKNLFNSFKDMLSSKYNVQGEEFKTNDEYSGYELHLYNNNKLLGWIDLYISKYNYVDKYSLHIDYTDYANDIANEQRKMDDL